MAFHGIPFRVCSYIVGNEIQPSLKSMKKDSPTTGFVYHPKLPMPMTKIGRMPSMPPKKKLQSNFPSSKINPPAFSPWGVKPPAFTRPGWTTPGTAGAAGAGAAGVAGAAFTVAEAREAPGNRFSGMVVMPLVI